MKTKKIQLTPCRISFVCIPTRFLDTQLNNIEGQHLKVYLLLQKAIQENEALDFEKIASKLQVSPQKVKEVFDSLEKKNIIRMKQKDDFNCEITINNNDREVAGEVEIDSGLKESINTVDFTEN